MAESTLAGRTPRRLQGMIVVDVDVHIHETPAALAPYCEQPWRKALEALSGVLARYLDIPGFAPAEFNITTGQCLAYPKRRLSTYEVRAKGGRSRCRGEGAHMSRCLNVAVLGCGRMGEIHGEAYAMLQDEVRVFYASRDRARAGAYAARFGGAGAFDSYDEAIRSPAIDLVDNCLPDALHVATTEAAFAAGKHVLVEKPMATSLAGADRMIRAGERAGKVLAVAENFRFMPHLERAKELLAEGALGTPFLIEVNHFERLQPSGWRAETGGIGGTLIDVGHHFVDMAVQLGGPVEWVFAQFAQRTLPRYTGEDTAVVMLGYRSGAIGHLTVTIGAPGAPPQPTFLACGTAASLYFDWQSGLWMGAGRAWAPATLILAKEPEPPDSFDYWGATIHACVQGVARDLRAGRVPPVTGAVARHDLAIILAAQQSARTREVVSVARDGPARR